MFLKTFSRTLFFTTASGENLRISAPHASYICPEGANITMECILEGSLSQPEDHLRHLWFFTEHQNEHCHPKLHPRPRPNHSSSMRYGADGSRFWLMLLNVTPADQGRYCCIGLDVQGDSQHNHKILQSSRNHVLLTITPRKSLPLQCPVHLYCIPPLPPGTVAVVLATTGMIICVISLPLILLLVYKQRQMAQSNRRNEARGHENPVYQGDGPQSKPRTVSQILTRQCSETGRHLLSDPGTPMSASGQGDVFFPAQEPIPESPDFMAV
ncbi:V-type immunoglobulin domain-containing suppressor of T-cell activation isoform X1 [Arapaima gigas]